ncbi:16S rRNA (guanine(966)-N(2))-methyltransferase RsmD [Neisseria perflava]|uniref:16S rRNA (guanine(966)-N(2))-methyltransferase RsmD n=1 Tax=Neisseria perflava TaxID=33053 RepID=UPI00209D2944|nr:16S rRNA (guanine(966)-N(2))-methyltransferase RsmD [Neisseria perflava]MCP1660041.1 16S rRNA (guanine(966)-N(2))-methyltransferase RsmD [Neisseria perflava]MCP1771941.1 16S rRNA (guanine(966)-N(2))-methyltransferase RsmD [Neisseria perflava]
MKQSKNSKHSNQVRIIGGTHRGRKLTFAAAEGLRPTPDMVREKLFNWLGQDLTGKTVLDLFAGSGALGLEAASRHAQQVVLVESNRQTAQNLRRNIGELGLTRAETQVSDGLIYLKNGGSRFDVVLLDPPFAWQQWSDLFAALQGRLKEGAFVYIEAGVLPEYPQWLFPYREGKSGMSRFALLQYAQAVE